MELSKFIGSLVGTGIGDSLGAGSKGFFGYGKVREMGRRYTDDTQMMMGESNRKLAHSLNLLHNGNLEDLAGVAEWVDFFSPPVCLNLYESVPLTVTKSSLFPSHFDQLKRGSREKNCRIDG